MLKLLRILFILSVAANYTPCYAQQTKPAYTFVPGDSVIFADGFSDDPVESFPSKWRIAPCNNIDQTISRDKKLWKIQNDSTGNELYISTSFQRIEPGMTARAYLPDSFTVEFDFKLHETASCAKLHFYPSGSRDSCKTIYVHLPSIGDLRISESWLAEDSERIANYPGTFFYTHWHHFALAYKKRAVDFYIDGNYMASLVDCKFTPYCLSLGCKAPVAYKHFKITTGGARNHISKLLTEKKFVTHSILFDLNRSTMMPESKSFMRDLAEFLVKNPSIKLEINGHTDIDGDAAANLKLSLARAEEVKRQLIAAGIQASRLTAKGCGDTKPLKPNTSAGNKAENRRVEFIRK